MKMCSTPAWRGKDALLRSAPGAGQQVFLTLLVYLLKLGTLDGKQIAALIGVAQEPFGYFLKGSFLRSGACKSAIIDTDMGKRRAKGEVRL